METNPGPTVEARPDAAPYTPTAGAATAGAATPDAPAAGAPDTAPNAPAPPPAAPAVVPPAARRPGRLARLRAYVAHEFRRESLAGRIGLATAICSTAGFLLFGGPRKVYHLVHDYFTHDQVAFARMLERLRKEDPEGQEYVIDTLAAFAREHDELRDEARRELARFVRRRTPLPARAVTGAARGNPCEGLGEPKGVGEHVQRAINAIGQIGAADGRPGVVELDATDLRAARLRDSLDLRGANFSGACLAHVQMRAVDLTGARLDWASLDTATLAGATLTGATLEGARLIGANLSGAVATADLVLRKANLTAATLDGVSFRNVDLSGANLTCAHLHQATLVDADWTDARLPWAYLDSAGLQGARAWSRVALVRGAYLARVEGLPPDALAWARANGAEMRVLGQQEWKARREEAYAAEPACGEP